MLVKRECRECLLLSTLSKLVMYGQGMHIEMCGTLVKLVNGLNTLCIFYFMFIVLVTRNVELLSFICLVCTNMETMKLKI
jgi:hypothetical protein